MEVRSYYASTVEAAMQLARKELGADAMLVQSSRTPPELAHLGRYEVVFAGEAQLPKPATPPNGSERVPSPRQTESRTPLKPTLAFPAIKLPVRLPSIIKGLAKHRLTPEEAGALGPVDLIPPHGNFSDILAAAGLNAAEAEAFFATGDQALAAAPIPAPPQFPPAMAIAENPVRELRCNPGLGHSGSPNATVALVGATGCGKTTSLMKLAIIRGVLLARPLRIAVFDPHRLGSTCKLSRFSELLDIPFLELDNLDDLSIALRKPFRGLTLIDTPGYENNEAGAIAEFALRLREHAQVEAQLVLSLSRKLSGNRLSISQLSPFRPARLILTGLDAASDYSDLEETVLAAAVPLSFLGTGQRIPEDLEPASSSRIAELLVNGWPRSKRDAA